MNVVHCQLWMGNLETYMTENFVIAAFRKMGEEPQTVRLMRNKYTGEPAGYCFVNFQSDEQAIDAMHKLNGKPIPGTNPVVRFRLNSASNSNKVPGNEREFSVWVGDLSSDVDDYSLYRAFSTKYTSIKTAKVILDTSGFSKGYGFVRFGLEEEQKAALYEMNGWIGLGSKTLKICNAVPKPKTSAGTATTAGGGGGSASAIAGFGGGGGSATDFSQYYDPTAYWQAATGGYASTTAAAGGGGSWQTYDSSASVAAQQPAVTDYTAYYQQQAIAHAAQQQQQQQVSADSWPPAAGGYHNQHHQAQAASHSHYAPAHQHSYYDHHHHQQQQQQHHHQQQQQQQQQPEDEDLALVDHKFVVDKSRMNREANERDRNLYDALEDSKWQHIEPLELF